MIDDVQIQQAMIANEQTGSLIIDVYHTKIAIVNKDNIVHLMTDEKVVEDVIMENQQNFLQRAYAIQSNRPKKSYMQFLPAEKSHPRNLRKVGCEPIEKKH
jgi:flagellar basal body P-ring protein FlgI